jgi:hypothetical protein
MNSTDLFASMSNVGFDMEEEATKFARRSHYFKA